ncbi:MAG: signal peptide peptidase SppA [Nevskiales bacterium]|nr:signal peptide peptidase SppA [Nevskiales bacterium]
MANDTSLIGGFFGLIWKVVRTIYRVVATLMLLAVIAVAWFSLRGAAPVTVDDNVALILAPTGELVEQIDADPGQRFVEELSGEAPSQSELSKLIDALDAAAKDDRITLAVLKLDGLSGAGLAQMDELRAAMKAFQATGKKIVAWSPWYDQIQYYAAAQADEIVLDPYGTVSVQGFGVYQNYFAEALDKLGVDVHVFRVGEYKSAVEPFTRNSMSDPAREANRAWLGDLWTAYGRGIAQSRDIDPSAAELYTAQLREGLGANGGDAAAYARDHELVTSLETLSEFRQRMAKIVGFDDDIGSFRQIYYLDYLGAMHREHLARAAGHDKAKVAVVVVQGEIVDGPGQVGQAGGDVVSDMLDEARRDPDVAAVVLRVNSPGGSVWAAEQIRREVQHLRADGKPVVASMSTLAASGGYWVSMDADQIWAHETTITGSIGVFGMIPTLDRSLAKLGIHTDGVGTTDLAGAFRIDRPLSPEVGAIVQLGIEKIYRDFISGVSEGRELPLDKVDEIARGRVWSGHEGKRLGLVDHIGGLQQAADAAAELAGLAPDAYRLDWRAQQRGFAVELLSQFGGGARILAMREFSAMLPAPLQQTERRAQQLLSAFNDPQGAYAYCFCSVAGARQD